MDIYQSLLLTSEMLAPIRAEAQTIIMIFWYMH